MIKKYGSHLPVYRQQADMDRDFGVSLSRSTLNGAIIAAGDLLIPVVKTLKADLLAGGYIQGDAPPSACRAPKRKAATIRLTNFNTVAPAALSSSTSR